jgi:hypothetical protein
MNISEAMKLRNKLKQKIEDLQQSVLNCDFGVRIPQIESEDDGSDEAKKYANLDGKTYDEALIEIDEIRDALRDLNLAIEKANEVNRLALNELHSLSSSISWEERMVRTARNFKESTMMYEQGSEKPVEVFFRRASKTDFVKRLASLKKRKDELEDVISANNGRTVVQYKLPDGFKIY